MKNKKITTIIIIILVSALVLLSAIFYMKKSNLFFSTNHNVEQKDGWFQGLKNEGGKFTSTDKKISFSYPAYIRLDRKENGATFWMIGDAKGDIGEMAVFGFDFVENRQGDISELYKENVFYKQSPKYYYGKKDIFISGLPAVQYNFCDMDNCSEKNMIREIFIEYKNKTYSFTFNDLLQSEILNSVQFNY